MPALATTKLQSRQRFGRLACLPPLPALFVLPLALLATLALLAAFFTGLPGKDERMEKSDLMYDNVNDPGFISQTRT
jgi:hypothetical protein